MIREKKICYFFKTGRKSRIISNHPDEFLYGMNYLKKNKFNIIILDNLSNSNKTNLSNLRKIHNKKIIFL